MSAVATALGNRCTAVALRTPASSFYSSLRTSDRRATSLRTPLVATTRSTSAVTRARAATVMSAAAGPPTYLLLTLDYVEDILEKRDPYRADHIAGAKAQEEAGKCVLAGALQNPTDKGVFVFKDCDEAYVKAFVEGDAYYKAGLVPSYTIRPWMIVVGA